MYDELNISDDDNQVAPSMHEVANCLKEAGSYDGTLSNEEMMQLYQVLNHSKSTATAEDEQRRILEETDRHCKIIDDIRKHSVPVNGSHNLESDEAEPTSPSSPKVKDDRIVKNEIKQSLDNFDEVDVFNSVPINHDPLPQLIYEPKYSPPLYCNTKIANLSLAEKKRIIFEYHKKLLQIYDNYQRRSSHYAPFGKPILSDVKFNGNLLKDKDKSVTYDFDDDNDFCQQDSNSNDIYVTKTGRQTKRKLYLESKDDEKKFKLSSVTPTSSQVKKRNVNSYSTKKEDLLKKSKVFASKSEKMYDKLNEKLEKDEEEEKENAKFMNSLQCESDDEFLDDPSDIATIVHSEEPVRRRIIPPLRGKKAGRGRPGLAAGKSKETVTKSTPNKKSSSNMYEPLETVTSSQSTDKTVGMCPICNMVFPRDKLETHANQCIDSYGNKNNVTSLKDNSTKMVCEFCDLVLPLSMDYEIHVRECLAKSKSMVISPR